MDPRTGIRKRLGSLVLVAVILGSVFVGVWSVRVALDDRSAASAARDLQVSAMRVATADAVRIAGGDPIAPGLDAAVMDLAGDHSAALDALPSPEASRAEALLVEIAGCGSWLLDPAKEVHEVHGHGELQALLDAAATSATANAAAAGRNAAVALASGISASLLGSSLLAGSRIRSSRRWSLAMSEQRASQRLAALVQDSPDVFVVIDPEGEMTYLSRSARRLLGENAEHRDDLVALAGDDSAGRLRIHLQRTAVGSALEVFELTDIDGVTGCFELRVSDLTCDPAVGGHLITARNVTAHHRLQNELRQQADTDTLTGLPNRRNLGSCLESAKRSMLPGSATAFVALDVDGFKGINDVFGHEAGDELLQLVAVRLSGAIGSVGDVLRMGSDDFAVVLPALGGIDEALEAAETLRAVFNEPFALADRVELLGVSVGIAFTGIPAEVEGLQAKAEIALMAAKRNSFDGVVVYEPVMEESIARTTRIRRAMHSAVYDDEFEIVYQPIVASRSGELTGLEALLRWNSPTVGVVGPDEFIPIAEATGDICPIGHWVIENVCRQVSTWTRLGMPDVPSVSFNVSARQLAEDNIVSVVSSAARAWEIDPGRLIVEVTETAALDQTGIAVGRLGELRNAGFRISIDDFGSGYSNLGQLLGVPFDVLKIDRSLLLMLTEMREAAGGDSTDPCQILEAIVSIAETLGVPVVCEGVETHEQLLSLIASGISHIQGYLTGRPASAAETTRLLGLARSAEATSMAAGHGGHQ